MAIRRKHIRNGLITLGASLVVAVGITSYVFSDRDFLTIAERDALITAYNVKIQEIKDDCRNDKRCRDGKVTFTGIQSSRDVVDKLNQWISEDEEDPTMNKR